MNHLSSEIFIDLIVEPNLPLQTHQARLASVSTRFAAMLAPLKAKRREVTKDAYESLGPPPVTASYPFGEPRLSISVVLELQDFMIQMKVGRSAPFRDGTLHISVVAGGMITVAGIWKGSPVHEQLVMQSLRDFIAAALRGDALLVF